MSQVTEAIERIARQLVSQDGEPYETMARVHYWRDKCIASANDLRVTSSASPPVEQSELVERCRSCGQFYEPCIECGTPPPVTVSVEEVERVAGFFFRARTKLPQAQTNTFWERSIEHHREMVAKYPEYAHARSVVHDCLRDAEIAIAARKEGHSLSTVSGVVK